MTSPLPQHASMHGSPSIFHLNAPRGRGGTDVRVQEVRAGPWCFRDPAMDGQPDRRGPRPGKTGTGSGIKTWVKERHYYPQASSKPRHVPPWVPVGRLLERRNTVMGQDRTGRAPKPRGRQTDMCCCATRNGRPYRIVYPSLVILHFLPSTSNPFCWPFCT
jgi:hypothetical protein